MGSSDPLLLEITWEWQMAERSIVHLLVWLFTLEWICVYCQPTLCHVNTKWVLISCCFLHFVSHLHSSPVIWPAKSRAYLNTCRSGSSHPFQLCSCRKMGSKHDWETLTQACAKGSGTMHKDNTQCNHKPTLTVSPFMLHKQTNKMLIFLLKLNTWRTVYTCILLL